MVDSFSCIPFQFLLILVIFKCKTLTNILTWEWSIFLRLQLYIPRNHGHNLRMNFLHDAWVRGTDRKIRGSLFDITRLRRVMPKSDSEGLIFLPASKYHDKILFLAYLLISSVWFQRRTRHQQVTLTSTILKADVICGVVMTSIPNVLTTELRDFLYNQCIDNTCCYSFFIYPMGRIRVCKIRFVSPCENRGKPCLVCKKRISIQWFPYLVCKKLLSYMQSEVKHTKIQQWDQVISNHWLLSHTDGEYWGIRILIFLFHTKFHKWAATWQNQQNEFAPSKDSDQSGHPPNLIRVFACPQQVAKDPRFLHADSEDSDQTGQMPRLTDQTGQMPRLISFCWFCRVAAEIVTKFRYFYFYSFCVFFNQKVYIYIFRHSFKVCFSRNHW